MEDQANKLVRETKATNDEVPNFSLEHLQNKLEYFNVKADFFENQTLILNQIIHKVEIKDKELSKEEQELTDKLAERAEVKKNLVKILEGLKNLRKMKTKKKNYETLTRTNGFYHCPECRYKTKWEYLLKVHINAVHRQLKPWKCSDCAKSKRVKIYHFEYFIKYHFSISDFSLKTQLSRHRLNMHNTNKVWICDCCGFRFGLKNVLKKHMMIHLPPSFSCPECEKKFVRAGHLNKHKKIHRGILNEVCKLCNKGCSTKDSLSTHIILNHFAKLHCEVTGCSSILSSKPAYKMHLKKVHKNDDQVLIGNLIKNLEKLRPNFQQLKYV